MSGYAVVGADDVGDVYAGSDVPGEFRPLSEALASEQLAITLIRVPPHSDFEQGTGHFHRELEELYLVGRGTLTMRFGDDVREVTAGSVVRVAPRTPRSHRNEGDEPVELWAISRSNDRSDATKIDDFWEASPHAAQRRAHGPEAASATFAFLPGGDTADMTDDPHEPSPVLPDESEAPKDPETGEVDIDEPDAGRPPTGPEVGEPPAGDEPEVGGA